MRLSRRGELAIGLACAAALAAASPARAQVATLGKGHSYFINKGVQIWGLDQGAALFNYNNLAGANFNGVMWSWEQAHKVSQLSPGQRWGKWTDPNGNPANALNATEQSKFADLMALQVGDEQQTDLENPNGVTKTWFQNAHAGNYFPNQLLYTNSFYISDDVAFANFIAQANPDAISFDSYPIDEPYGSVILPHNWLALAGRFRRHALSSYATFNGAPIGSNAPRPYGMYLQTYAASEGAGKATRHPGDVEMRWQQFTAWTMGFTFVDAFTVGGSSSLFNNSNHNDISQPRYDQFKESARQGRNLGPALVRLISYGYGPSIVIGKDAAGNNNPVPSDWLPFNAANAPAQQPYLTAVSATNPGAKNNGQPGDVYVGFFNPLHTSFGNPAGETYFMITNALGAYLDDETATVAQTTQHVTLNFDFGWTTINSLQRLNRNTGQVEVVPLTHVSGTQWRLGTAQQPYALEGGTGDLYKYLDGHVFVGAQQAQPTVYWDNDGVAGNNNTATGAGMGGSGNWDTISPKWHDGASNGTWAPNRNPVFWGAPGSITVVSPPSVDSMTFKTNGYLITGSSIDLNRPFVRVDAGVTAAINSTLNGTTGLTKEGGGTLGLTAANTYTGGTTIKGGVVRVSTDAALGAAPSVLMTNIALDGGTLQWAGNFDLSNMRGIGIGPGGGTIDTQGFTNPAGYNATAGGFRGPGDLTKIGSGTFFASATSGGLNTSWKGRLIIKEGTWKIVASDGLPYNAPLGDGLQAGQITLDGGTWQAGATMNITNARRGITVAAGGGTIDTQAFNLTWAGPMAGTTTTSVLNKTGSGMLRFTGVTFPSTYNGIVNVNNGTLQLDNGNTMGDLASLNVAGTLAVTGSETIGSLAGGGAVNLSAITLTTGDNNNSTTFAGVIGGAGGLTKAGSGTMTLAGANTYTGATNVNSGRLVLAQSLTKSSSLTASGSAVVELASDGTSTRVIKTGAVTIGAAAALDLRDNKLITTSAPGAATGGVYNGLQGQVQRAFNFGDWNAAGLTTSMPQALDGITTIGVGTGEQIRGLGATQTDMFAGQTITGASTIAMYTYAGDANLDGQVDAGDYGTLDFFIQIAGASGYANGDFNYDGFIDPADYGTIDNSIQFQGPPIATSGGAVQASGMTVAVPEPGAASFALLAAAATLVRHRRRISFN